MAKRKKSAPRRRACVKPLAVVALRGKVFECCGRKLGKATTVACKIVPAKLLAKRELRKKAAEAAAQQRRELDAAMARATDASVERAELLPEYFGGLGSASGRRRRRRSVRRAR